MLEDPKIKRQLAQQGRLWALSVVCALAGALTIARTNSLVTGIGVFLVCLVVLGGALLVYERRRSKGR